MDHHTIDIIRILYNTDIYDVQLQNNFRDQKLREFLPRNMVQQEKKYWTQRVAEVPQRPAQ